MDTYLTVSLLILQAFIIVIKPSIIVLAHPLTNIAQLSGDTGGSADASEYPRERLE
jgi:hypothetical protein